ncbi:MAG TPA: hypothetical protein VMW34_17890, partial [Anaerolineales bacterium]|nr:hypothetical protein [Anaerolineales bacterium]
MKQKNLPLYLFATLILLAITLGYTNQALAEEGVSTAYYSLNYQEEADLYLGKAGVFMVSS